MAIRNSTYHMGCIRDLHLGEGEVVRVIDRTIQKSYDRLSIVTTALSDHSAAICYQMSATLKSIGGGSLWIKILWCSL